MDVALVTIKNVLTRTSGYLTTVASHSLQPYRGCSLGRALCGSGCYVQHSRHLLGGRQWGSFLDVRQNAADSYRQYVVRERAWARPTRGRFAIFLSSATEPFPPQERQYRVTGSLIDAMLVEPPDLLILQTHAHRVTDYLPQLVELAIRCQLRVHISVETDRERLPGLPPHASSIDKRLRAAAALRASGITTVITVSPLLPIADPNRFFARLATAADAVVLDHFIEGDGTADGRRTRATPLPAAMAAVEQRSVDLAYRDSMASIARRHLPGRVGVSIAGFAGNYS